MGEERRTRVALGKVAEITPARSSPAGSGCFLPAFPASGMAASRQSTTSIVRFVFKFVPHMYKLEGIYRFSAGLQTAKVDKQSATAENTSRRFIMKPMLKYSIVVPFHNEQNSVT